MCRILSSFLVQVLISFTYATFIQMLPLVQRKFLRKIWGFKKKERLFSCFSETWFIRKSQIHIKQQFSNITFIFADRQWAPGGRSLTIFCLSVDFSCSLCVCVDFLWILQGFLPQLKILSDYICCTGINVSVAIYTVYTVYLQHA